MNNPEKKSPPSNKPLSYEAHRMMHRSLRHAVDMLVATLDDYFGLRQHHARESFLKVAEQAQEFLTEYEATNADLKDEMATSFRQQHHTHLQAIHQAEQEIEELRKKRKKSVKRAIRKPPTF